MRVGILTLKLHFNYGGILQAYALQEYLKKLGHDVVLIDCQNKNSNLIFCLKRWVMKHVFQKKYQTDKKKHISQQIEPFVLQYFTRKTDPISSGKGMKQLGDGSFLDAIVVGSDQVWRPEYAKELTPNYFLDFAGDNVKKLSYAASFGVDEWKHSAELTSLVTTLLARFDALSVREESAVALCSTIFGAKAGHHIDPTLLLEAEDYVRLIKDKVSADKPGNIFAYVLDDSPEKNRFITMVSETIVKPIEVLYLSKYIENFNGEILPSVETWISKFYYADYIVTDSFHGCVFSIIFNKPFIAIGNKRRGMTRFTSLLKSFNLESRLLLEAKDLNERVIQAPINWSRVNELICEKRNEASEYLSKTLTK